MDNGRKSGHDPRGLTILSVGPAPEVDVLFSVVGGMVGFSFVEVLDSSPSPNLPFPSFLPFATFATPPSTPSVPTPSSVFLHFLPLRRLVLRRFLSLIPWFLSTSGGGG